MRSIDTSQKTTLKSPRFQRTDSKFEPQGRAEQMIREKDSLRREKSYSILHHLDRQDGRYHHKYKDFANHNKTSDLQETKHIITELLNRHAYEKSLGVSEQYILTGYLGKYIEFSRDQPRLMRNPFNITGRLATGNNGSEDEPVSPTRSPSPKRRGKTQKKAESEKKIQLTTQLIRLKFMWQVYQLKALVCPALSRSNEQQETNNHREMLEIMSKLKELQRNKNKLGEEKTLTEVSKVMKRFQAKVKAALC